MRLTRFDGVWIPGDESNPSFIFGEQLVVGAGLVVPSLCFQAKTVVINHVFLDLMPNRNNGT